MQLILHVRRKMLHMRIPEDPVGTDNEEAKEHVSVVVSAIQAKRKSYFYQQEKTRQSEHDVSCMHVTNGCM
jgi:hypothetical protein